MRRLGAITYVTGYPATGFNDADNCVAHRVTVGRFRGLIVFGGSDLHSPRRFSVRDSEEPALWLGTFYG
jgi:hypothetical protein